MYKLARADNQNNNKRGGVGIYFQKLILPTRQVELNNLSEYIVFEVRMQNKKGYITLLYRSPSQTHDEFDNFLVSFEQVLCDIVARNPFFVLKIGDFNARTAKWWRNDTATTEGTKIDSITTSYGFSQITSDPTHILPNSSSVLTLFLHTTNLT